MQAFRPSNHLCFTFLLPAPPQFLNQAPPGAQQLTRPDLSNVPHFGHIIELVIVGVMDGVLTDAMIGVLGIKARLGNGRSGIGRRNTNWRVGVPSVVSEVGVDVHAVCDIEPELPTNM